MGQKREEQDYRPGKVLLQAFFYARTIRSAQVAERGFPLGPSRRYEAALSQQFAKREDPWTSRTRRGIVLTHPRARRERSPCRVVRRRMLPARFRVAVAPRKAALQAAPQGMKSSQSSAVGERSTPHSLKGGGGGMVPRKR